MGATIGEPFILSNHDILREQHQRCIFAHCSSGLNSRSETVLTVQGEGVRITDLPSLHTLSSQTFEPSITLTAPAISVLELTPEGRRNQSLYIASQHGSPLESQKDRFRISKWSQTLSDDLSKGLEKTRETAIPWKVDFLCGLDSFTNHILVSSSAGDIISLSTELQTRESLASSTKDTRRLQTFVFQRQKCSFPMPQNTPQHALYVFNVLTHTTGCIIQPTISVDGNLERLSDVIMPLDAKILDVTLDPSGHMSILVDSGVWCSYQLSLSSNDTFSQSPLGSPITLKVENLAQDGVSLSEEQVSLMSLASSRVMMACVMWSTNPELRLTIWDLRYSVVLASQAFPLTQSCGISFSEDLSIFTTLVPATSEQCLVILQPYHRGERAGKALLKGLSLIVSMSVSTTSSVALALNCLQETSKWRASPPSGARASADSVRQTLLNTIRSQGDSSRAGKIFFEWIGSQDSKLDKHDDDDIEIPGSMSAKKLPGKTTQDNKKKDTKTAICPYAFTAELVQIILSPTFARDDYTKILVYLLERRLVSQNMIPGGVSNSLMERGDWESIDVALKCITDMSEVDLVSLLHRLVIDDEETLSTKDEMEVDVQRRLSNKTTLTKVLARCLRYPTSQGPLRHALHAIFKDVRHILPILRILDEWVESWTSKGPLIDFNGDLDDPKSLADPRALSKKVERKTGMPPVENILLFIQTILDTFFIPLMQYKEAEPVLSSLRIKVQPAIEQYRALEYLRGPLDPFTHVSSEPLPSKLKKKILTRDLPGMPIKAYQIEEIFL